MYKEPNIGDYVEIRDGSNHHTGIRGFYVGIDSQQGYGHHYIWHPYQMWRLAGDRKHPVVNKGSITGWNLEHLLMVQEGGSLCSECEEWFVGENEYLCPSCRP